MTKHIIGLCKIYPARGHGTGIHEVYKVDKDCYLTDIGWIYITHTYMDMQAKTTFREYKKARAEKVGKRRSIQTILIGM